MAKALNFKSKASYKKWLGYVQATGLAKRTPGNTPIKIKGTPHRVHHARKVK